MSSKRKRFHARRRSTEPLEVCSKITDLYIILLIGVFPLVVGTGDYGYGNLVRTKMWFWFEITALWLIALACYMIRCRRKRQEVPVRFRWFHGVALAFLGVNVVSAILSDYPKASFLRMDGSNTNSVLIMAFYAAVFTGVSLFGRLRGEHIRALGISVFLSGCLSELQLAGYNPLTMYPEGMTYYNKHKEYASAFLGTLGNVDILAAFLCFAIPVLTVYAVRSSVKHDRLLGVPALLSLHILYCIDVDAALVGLTGCLILALPVVIRDRKRAKYAAVVSGAAVLLGLAVVYFWPGEKGLLYEASRILHGQIEPSFGHDRVEIWMKAWKSVVKRPVLGSGPCSGVWLLRIQKVNYEMNRVNAVYNAHNTYLGYLMDTGILGLGCYLTLVGRGIAVWIRNRGDNLIAALGAGVVCYLVQDFFNINLVVVAPLLWAALGLLAGERSAS